MNKLFKNLLRIKINNNSIMKFCLYPNGEDFYCWFPTLSVDKHSIDSHFSFHSKSGRVTFKTTSIKEDGKEMIVNILNMARNNPSFENAVTNKDLDLFKGKIITFDQEEIFHQWFTFALNTKNMDFNKTFGHSKTTDSTFQNILDIETTETRDQITINSFVGKNIKKDFSSIKKKYDMIFSVKENNFLNDTYTFVFCLNYSFDIKKNEIIKPN